MGGGGIFQVLFRNKREESVGFAKNIINRILFKYLTHISSFFNLSFYLSEVRRSQKVGKTRKSWTGYTQLNIWTEISPFFQTGQKNLETEITKILKNFLRNRRKKN